MRVCARMCVHLSMCVYMHVSVCVHVYILFLYICMCRCASKRERESLCVCHVHWLFTLWQLPKGQLGQQVYLRSRFRGLWSEVRRLLLCV